MSIADSRLAEQFHANIFRGWDTFSLKQKRNTITLIKKLTSEWQHTYLTKIGSLEKMLSDLNLHNVSLPEIQALEAQTKLFKVCKSSGSIFLRCLRNYEILISHHSKYIRTILTLYRRQPARPRERSRPLSK